MIFRALQFDKYGKQWGLNAHWLLMNILYSNNGMLFMIPCGKLSIGQN